MIDLLPALWNGIIVTVEVTLYSAFFALIISIVAGLSRLSKYAIVRQVTVVYVEIFRGTSLLVQLFWFYYVLPLLGVTLPTMVVAVLAFALNYGAYGSEIVRSAILAIPKGQWEASIALNMTPFQRMRVVILPQAFVRMIPPFGNLLIELLKGTALVSLITLNDLTAEAMLLSTTYIDKSTMILGSLLVIYFIIAYILTLAVRFIERKAAAGRS
ncbi:ectoine/hydroxyectoine ABC transporter permease subunit EhuC [Brevibacillus humidisoli]|uniref:ectoine/hydroxyectoine ABC transporter permease subunit EhuC n=1 Tax=Brevibacillus humidisoli TaxID=2895522 RepID=UPI001E288B69|nr:ectoine/hydroxyectoine ABC transporter permease subunit EhuC [Brevibacillus humidisoli]UFJ40262.1 ectoine/hydroxyectoine ABC transporter permease subunit EhuC [Brevibacillus humidisoli]